MIQLGECNSLLIILQRVISRVGFRPCFNEGERLSGIQRGDAHFVDIIHTNAGVLGIKESRGDVDFYPNGYIYQIFHFHLIILHWAKTKFINNISLHRQYSLQPGCWTIMCAHSRAYEYFAETVFENNGNNFIGTQCNSLSSLRDGKCTSRRIPMGIDTPATARGNYYLETNKKSPFGRSFQKYDKMQQLAKLIHKLDQFKLN